MVKAFELAIQMLGASRVKQPPPPPILNLCIYIFFFISIMLICMTFQDQQADQNQISSRVNLSLVHMHNIHPGANIHPGCKFAPGCILVM